VGDFIQDALDFHPMASLAVFFTAVLLFSFVVVMVAGSGTAQVLTVETSQGTFECVRG
jgi:hypothetical protein